jgi:hypothetical protein
MNSTLAAQNQVPISVLTSVNIYTYDPRDLWLAYGIACGVTLLAALLGLFAIFRNGGVGYESTFSTYIRATQDYSLKEMIGPTDRGAQPLPKRLADANVKFNI